MNRLLLLAVILVGCAPLTEIIAGPGIPDWANGSRSTNGWVLKPSRPPGVTVSSPFADITDFTGPCAYQEVSQGAKRALKCNSPSTITLENTGAAINVRLLSQAPIR